MNDKGFFYADYNVGKVTVASKTVDAGQYAADLLNQYYKDDTAARISVFRAENWELEDTLSKGYLNPRLFVEAVTVINDIFTALPKLKPFNLITSTKKRNESQTFSLMKTQKYSLNTSTVRVSFRNTLSFAAKKKMKNTSCGFFIIMKTRSTQRL